MVYLDEKLYNEYGVKLYRMKDYSSLNILAESSRNTCDEYTTCDAFVCEQNGKYYVFGSGRNTLWMGYKMKTYNAKDTDIIELFEKYQYMNS